MNRITFILIRMLLLSQIFAVVDARSFNNQANENNKRFIRINIPIISSTDSCNYYPINTGDFWEYIEKDTTTLLGQFYFGLNFSVTREVLKDTLFDNGKIYKQIKWENVANSVNYEPRYEYHRIDSTGKVYLNYSNQDYLLFDFTLPIGQTYSAHIPNHFWLLSDKYYVIGFGDTLHALDFKLYEAGNIIKETYTLVENFGITYYQKDMVGYGLPEGNFWGAVINGKTHGTLLIKKTIKDWRILYPLQIGNFWKYSSSSGIINSIITKRIVAETLMTDFNVYSVFKNVNHTLGNTAYSYSRVDSMGNIYFWQSSTSSSKRYIKLSIIVGDTAGATDTPGFFWRIINKVDSSIFIYLYPDFIYASEQYTKGIGLTNYTIQGGGGYLMGAVIDGVIYGDTAITSIEDDKAIDEKYFELYQNYPNPFNSSTIISYYLSRNSRVKIAIYDLLGREIKIIVDEVKAKGKHFTLFNANSISSGNYICVINVDGYTSIKKIILIK